MTLKIRWYLIQKYILFFVKINLDWHGIVECFFSTLLLNKKVIIFDNTIFHLWKLQVFHQFLYNLKDFFLKW